MIWLITQMAGWLLLTMACFALVGWAWAAERAAPAESALRREREKLVRDIVRLGGGEAVGDTVERERESDAMRRMLQIRDGRIAELEQALSAARSRADEGALRIAELERAPPPSPAENEEIARLRALAAQNEEQRSRELVVSAEPVADGDQLLQAWRLRYFEQRVRYLEGQKSPPVKEIAAPALAWRVREAEARAAHLESEVRSLAAAPQAEDVEPFAANADVDKLLRWRMLYLERRVEHLQAAPAAPELPLPTREEGPDPDIWKWRARYLEARVRHMEQAPPAIVTVAGPGVEEPTQPGPPRLEINGVKPPVLSAPRDGLPDDFTLIEGLSGLQQSTLNALGVFHFDQIAAWSTENIAWVDRYLYLRGRIEEEEWVEQAGELARDGVGAARRQTEDA